MSKQKVCIILLLLSCCRCNYTGGKQSQLEVGQEGRVRLREISDSPSFYASTSAAPGAASSSDGPFEPRESLCPPKELTLPESCIPSQEDRLETLQSFIADELPGFKLPDLKEVLGSKPRQPILAEPYSPTSSQFGTPKSHVTSSDFFRPKSGTSYYKATDALPPPRLLPSPQETDMSNTCYDYEYHTRDIHIVAFQPI